MKFQPLCRQCVQEMIQKYMDEVDTSLLSQIMHHQVKVIKFTLHLIRDGL